jgi:hypothetical protein
MGPSQHTPALRTYAARFERGPRDGSVTSIVSLDTGQPPDVLLDAGQSSGVYALAGGPRADGSLPYWWMPRRKAAAQAPADTSTS